MVNIYHICKLDVIVSTDLQKLEILEKKIKDLSQKRNKTLLGNIWETQLHLT